MKLLYTAHNIADNLLVDNESYSIKYNHSLAELGVHLYKLYRGKAYETESTVDTIYYFIQGTGVMIINNQTFRVGVMSSILVPSGSIVQVINDGDMNLCFNSVARR